MKSHAILPRKGCCFRTARRSLLCYDCVECGLLSINCLTLRKEGLGRWAVVVVFNHRRRRKGRGRGRKRRRGKERKRRRGKERKRRGRGGGGRGEEREGGRGKEGRGRGGGRGEREGGGSQLNSLHLDLPGQKLCGVQRSTKGTDHGRNRLRTSGWSSSVLGPETLSLQGQLARARPSLTQHQVVPTKVRRTRRTSPFNRAHQHWQPTP